MPLFALPMMASGLIFFAQASPPNPKGFYVGTAGSTLCALALIYAVSLPATVAAGLTSGAILIFFKYFNAIFPPTAVLGMLLLQSTLGSAVPSPSGLPVSKLTDVLSFLAFPWLAGHAWLYGSALVVSRVRVQVKKLLSQLQIRDDSFALTGSTLQAALKMRTDATGAEYAIYWTNANGKLVVTADYQTDSMRKELGARGLASSYAEASSLFQLQAGGGEATQGSTIANVLEAGKSLFVQNVSASSMWRKDLAKKYGIQSVVFEPLDNAIIEIGIASRPWASTPPLPAIPSRTMRRAFETMGASYTIFWARNSSAGGFTAVSYYTTASRRKALRQVRALLLLLRFAAPPSPPALLCVRMCQNSVKGSSTGRREEF